MCRYIWRVTSCTCIYTILSPVLDAERLQSLRPCTVISEWPFTNTVVLDHATGISLDFVDPTECTVIIVQCHGSKSMPQILHLLKTYGVFTDASPTPEMVCLTETVVIIQLAISG
ncbi:hypothetical protein Bbelb_350210 [Branchiostoma belcheri]|nr:hypothetical protein Bbelb_350210 [Branchiostoma belcheri]